MSCTEPLKAPEGAPFWKKVVHASDCSECDYCGEPVCETCDSHYADCDCPGPTQGDEFEYREVDGVMEARRLPE